SNVNIDGFYLASDDFEINAEETQRLQRLHLSNDGYVGLDIGGDTVFPGAFDGFSVVGRSFDGEAMPVQVQVTGEGDKETVLREREPMRLRDKPQQLEFPASALDELSDGPYDLEILA